MEKIVLKVDRVMKAGNEFLAGGVKNNLPSTITKDNVLLALIFMIGTVFVVHDLTKHSYGADIETENTKVSFKPREYYSPAV
ncbi:hypothetical protein KPL47_22820 [Clostridium estertheticum]|uniref:hypothetical protein n=1 Tax=Clostridium TaxID=1485 RepID=UPI001C0E77D3|nr:MULTISPECIES: hypothetical protein [Clostridium]MBU3146528.1 hypothetical protein [Clostridium sp. CF012]MBU3179131.1 hypothetical protein [Clostridium estertheticum]